MWATYISTCDQLQKQHQISVLKKLFYHHKSSFHKATVELAGAQKEMLENV